MRAPAPSHNHAVSNSMMSFVGVFSMATEGRGIDQGVGRRVWIEYVVV